MLNMEFDDQDIRAIDEGQSASSTNRITSIIAYLIGVETRFFGLENKTLDPDAIETLDEDRAARIIRNLCIVRTALINNGRAIKLEIKHHYKNINTMPEYIPEESLVELRKHGIYLNGTKKVAVHKYIVEINREISSRINNCRHLLPEWVVWDYMKSLFLMPDGLQPQGVYNELKDRYYPNKTMYPYTCYINWTPSLVGNLLENDRKFLNIIYHQNGQQFKDYNYVMKMGDKKKQDILNFIEDSHALDIIVDCENADPYRLAVALNNLSEDVSHSIEKLILIDDPNTSKAWEYFEKLVPDYTIEYIRMNRISERKSLVDIGLTAALFKEYYENNIDSFIICSSDSDFWAVIEALPDVNFLVLVENEGLGRGLMNALTEAGVPYAYTEEFYAGEGETMGVKTRVLLSEFREKVEGVLDINLKCILEETLREFYIPLNEDEKKQFFNRFVKTMQINIQDDGAIQIERK